MDALLRYYLEPYHTCHAPQDPPQPSSDHPLRWQQSLVLPTALESCQRGVCTWYPGLYPGLLKKEPRGFNSPRWACAYHPCDIGGPHPNVSWICVKRLPSPDTHRYRRERLLRALL